jgi:crossover junction endodeoxyribonuclease RuvC
MVVLGIDPGIGRTGWGVISYINGKAKALDYGCFETAAHGPLTYRLTSLRQEIVRIIEKYKPLRAGIEAIYFNTNTKTAMTVGQARGVIIETLAEKNVLVDSYTPQQIKLAVTGYGKADKNQVGAMIKMLLGLKEVPTPDDTADALAIALTCAVTKRYGA